jgi:PAS domain S-box-containing protein
MSRGQYLGEVGDHICDILFVFGADGRVVDANAAAVAQYGYSFDELLERTVFDIRLPDDRPTAVVQLGRAHSEGQQFETVHRRKDGTTFPVEVSTSAVPIDGVRVIFATIRDITSRKQAEQHLRESEERFRLFTEVAFEGVVIHDGTIVADISPVLAHMAGYEVDEVIGRSIFEFIAPEMKPRILDDIAKAASYVSHVMLCRRKDGTSFPIEASARMVTYRGRSMRAVSVRDVSERVAAEQKLRQSEQGFRSMIERTPYGIAVSRDEKFVYVNPAFARLLRYDDANELVGRAPEELVPAELREVVRENIRVNAEGGNRSSSERPLRRKDGTLVRTRIVGFQVYFEGEPASMGIFEDVSENRRLEDELRQAQKMEAVGRLAGGVAHDFNNLLTAILGHSELLQQSLQPGTAPRRQAEQIHRAALRGSQLTGQLLAFSRKQVLQPKVLDLDAVVGSMSSMLERLIGEDIELEEDLQPSLWPVKADPGQIEQVLLNLAVNARDAMPRGGHLLIRTRNIDAARAAAFGVEARRWVMLEVQDSGHGMSPETLTRVFEPFFTTKPRGKGTGLGLATVYGIVTQSGGHISVESEPEKGALFRVLLPAAEEALTRAVSAEARAPLAGGGESILLVEDDADVRQFIHDVLAGHGYKVLPAKDGPEALTVARRFEGPLHLLLTDVVMPRMTGAEVATTLVRDRPDLKVLYISGYPGETMVKQGVLAPELRFLQKPFSVGDLTRRVRELLDTPAISRA